MNDIEQNVIAWILSTVLGSGIVLTGAWWALRGRLSEVFVTKKDAAQRKQIHEADIMGLRGHIDSEFLKVDRTMEGLTERVKANEGRGARAEAKTDVLTERMEGQSARIGDIHAAFQKTDAKLEKLSEHQAGMTEALKGIGRSLDQLRDEMRGRA